MQVSSKQKILILYLILFGLLGPLTFWAGNQGTQDFPQVKTLSLLKIFSPNTWGLEHQATHSVSDLDKKI
ncbi:MAG: hypothetical protein WA902_24120, partial [Thermosynechococcaceae cyanobacterium]